MGRVDVEWRRGADGTGGTYVFSPRPVIQRNETIQKLVEFKIPLSNASVTQLLGRDSRTLTLRGVLVQPDPNYDKLDKQRRDFIAGLDTSQPGQLHLISNLGTPDSRHVFYRGLVTKVSFEEQRNSQLLEYTIEILLSDPTEVVV